MEVPKSQRIEVSDYGGGKDVMVTDDEGNVIIHVRPFTIWYGKLGSILMLTGMPDRYIFVDRTSIVWFKSRNEIMTFCETKTAEKCPYALDIDNNLYLFNEEACEIIQSGSEHYIQFFSSQQILTPNSSESNVAWISPLLENMSNYTRTYRTDDVV